MDRGYKEDNILIDGVCYPFSTYTVTLSKKHESGCNLHFHSDIELIYIENGSLTAGFYAYKSHRIIPCSDCLLQPAEFEKGIHAFEKWVEENNITSFDERTGRGLLRHIYFRKAFGTGEIMACAVVNGKDIPDTEYLVAELQKAFDHLKSVVLNINLEKTNVILGNETKTIWGSDKITDVLLSKKFVLKPPIALEIGGISFF